MMFLLKLMLMTVVGIQARIFNNPILSDKSYYQPGAIKVNGTYYVVASLTSDTSGGVFPVHTSTDLMEWRSAGSLIDGNNAPAWANIITLLSPEIHQIGSNFLLYFSAMSPTNPYFDVGVATSLHPLGPYESSGDPIVAIFHHNSWYPSVINDQGKLYLLWANYTYSINARQLNEDGLSFISEQTTTLLKSSLEWEEEYVSFPWYLKRGKYHYLLYNGYCKVGVARSFQALGTYEKLDHPLIAPKGNYTCIIDVSVVKDVDDQSDVIFFNSAIKGSYVVLLASLNWDDDGWPYIGEF